MIAARAPQYLSLGTATLLAAGLALAPSSPPPSTPALEIAPPRDSVGIHAQSTEPACNPDEIRAVVVRGQFTARQPVDEGFAISFAGAAGHYTAITDPRGYFEVRIPREDFDGDPCHVPLTYRDFSDAQMTLRYRIDIER